MKPDEPPTRNKWEQLLFSYMIWIWLAPLLPLLILILYFAFSGPSASTSRDSNNSARTTESALDGARQVLTRQSDLKACRTVLEQVNAELGENPALRPPPLTNEEKTWLRDQLSLSDEEMREVESSHYTPLDRYHLFRCSLLRDVAGALEIKGVRGKIGKQAVREKPLERAARAFAWVMREVRLRPHEGEAAPPSFVVRRGWGSALERALIFLALLEQLGDPDAAQPELLGFLLHIPDGSGGSRLWTCGVVVDDGKEVYLFDPRLGLPLPGPNGEGIATLTQARQQPEVLAQLHVGESYQYLTFPFDLPACLCYLALLHVGEKLQYPVTAEQARAAQARLVCPLSALSPRMRYLQEKLLAPAVRVRLAAAAAADQQRVTTACSAGVAPPFIPPARGGNKGGGLVARDQCTLLQRFLPAEEGGVDTTSAMKRFYHNLVPWQVLPAGFRDERRFPPNSQLGQQVLGQFAAFFYYPTMDTGRARDLLLRGRYSAAVPVLVSERERCRNSLVQSANAVDLEDKAQKWLNQALEDYARLERAKRTNQPEQRQRAEEQVKRLWEKDSLPIAIILSSFAAAARAPEVDYQLALCAQEQAEQLQARLDLQARVGATAHPRDVEKARADWHNARNAWMRFDEDYPRHPDRAAARLLRGRAEAMLGEHKAALASWKKVAGFRTDLERIASRYLARQWRKKHPQ